MAHSKVFFESLFKVMYSILFNVKTGKGERMIGNVKKNNFVHLQNDKWTFVVYVGFLGIKTSLNNVERRAFSVR